MTLTMHRDAETVRQALRAGASGYVVKGAHTAELVEAIRAVRRGERYLHGSARSSPTSPPARPHTVRRHVANLSAKLGLSGPKALTRYAVEHGLARED